MHCSWDVRDVPVSVQLMRGSIKQPARASSNNCTMNAIVDEIPEIATALAKWYADHSSIRRLWATADAIALRILVAIEPTSDGDDTLPIWLANKHWWTSDLRLRLKREVQLQLVVSGSEGELGADGDAVTIVDVSWRDSWMAP
jgi:hypothetical protein